MTTVETNT